MANGTNANKGSAYIADAGRWEEEIYQERAVQARRWRNVAFTLMGVILLMGAALAGLIPLKEFRPYVITVDAETGHAEATLVAQTGPLAQDEAVIRSLIGQYVIQRETYDLYDGQQRYNNILELSVGRALNGYRELWKASNPDYPYGRYGDDSIITITVTGISLLNRNTANVQYIKTLTRNGRNPVDEEFVAIVGFDFAARKTNLGGIIRNPLGFVVKSWRSDKVFKG